MGHLVIPRRQASTDFAGEIPRVETRERDGRNRPRESGSMRAFLGERFSVSQRVAGGPKGDRRGEGAGVGIMH